MPVGGSTSGYFTRVVFCIYFFAMRIFRFVLVLLAGSLMAFPALAQTDTILRTDGTEVPGRVLTITPLEVRYLPPAGADTLRLAAADVFLVRYANGTREVLHPVTAAVGPAAAPDLLPGLSEAQRRAQGRTAAARNYTERGPFWISLGTTLYAGPLLGVVAPAVIAPRPVALDKLRAPQPELLADPAYGDAYRAEAKRRKRSQAWGGYGAGVAVWVVLIASLNSMGP